MTVQVDFIFFKSLCVDDIPWCLMWSSLGTIVVYGTHPINFVDNSKLTTAKHLQRYSLVWADIDNLKVVDTITRSISCYIVAPR